MRGFQSSILLLMVWSVSTHVVVAQVVSTTTPQSQISDSYYEGLGISWGLQGNGWSFNFPGGNMFPAFGGANPNAGLSGGAVGRVGNVSGHLGFNWAQGSNRFSGVTASSLTTMDGYPGSMFSGTVRPFVTSITPIVGFQTPNDHIRQAGIARQNATLNSIAQKKAEVQRDKAYEHWKRGQQAEEKGNLKMARANYRLALAKANEPLRTQVIQRMVQHGWIRP